ncbi:ATP-binding protein [Pseudomonas sp. HR96]|uniref:ATP-binding protein n=1 Tax=Pseudomonas sp. HR96 TaxID=1027966 RepID=UPI002A74F626|nr:ATP-binding protein [Pseudomonas sp. HR96]WPP01546.1 ATP-binding protein [Pseudomonas sp. HR96]
MHFLTDSHGCEGWRGEMAGRIREFAWETTQLGPIEQWGQALSGAVQFLLGSPVPLVMLWGEPGYMLYNDAYSGFAGGRHPFLLGKPVEVGWPEVADFNRNVVNTCLAGGTLSYRSLQLQLFRNGQPEDVWMDLYYSPVPGDDGAPAGVMSIVVETTAHVLSERQRKVAEQSLRELTRHLEQRVNDEVQARSAAEEQLRQSQKLEAIGGLTGGVAHDFNNVLQVIAGNLHLLARQRADDEVIQRRVHSAVAAVERGAKLSAQLLAFARRQPLSPAVYNVHRLHDSLGELLQRALGETIHLQLSLPAEAWAIYVDRNQLENAVLNLAINARDAMQGEGIIQLTGRNLRLDEEFCQGKDIGPGEYVCLTVSDEGCGMSSEVLEHAFEPFYTTKPDGHGTGLGLSMVFGFVKQSGGHIEMLSTPGVGTTVHLYFARSHQPEAAEPAALEAAPAAVGARVLVVEDDPQVRETAVELLRQAGYKVQVAGNGDEALRLLETGEPIDLIFTDVVMPGRVKSADLAVWAKRQQPPVAVLFTSGHTRDIISDNHQLTPDTHLLSKPYSPQTLWSMVRAVLGSDQDPGDTHA